MKFTHHGGQPRATMTSRRNSWLTLGKAASKWWWYMIQRVVVHDFFDVHEVSEHRTPMQKAPLAIGDPRGNGRLNVHLILLSVFAMFKGRTFEGI